MKDPSNQDPTIGVVCGENSCASENDNQTWRDWTPTEQALISLSQLDPSSRVIFQTLSMAGMKKTEGFKKRVYTRRKPAEVIPVGSHIS